MRPDNWGALDEMCTGPCCKIDDEMDTPDPLLFYTDVIACAQCGYWWCRIPKYECQSGIGESCDRCGNSSIKVRDGRPFGPKSGWRWELAMNDWNKFLRRDCEEQVWRRDEVITWFKMPDWFEWPD